VRKWKNEERKRRQWLAKHPEVVAFEQKRKEQAEQGWRASEAKHQEERQKVIDRVNEVKLQIQREKEQGDNAIAEHLAAQQQKPITRNVP
jgi:hypothetical protein